MTIEQAGPVSTVIVPRARGPRTAAGKRRSSRNAIKHGILSKRIFQDDENRADFESLHEGLIKSLHPQGTAEEVCVEKLAVLTLRQRRLYVAEEVLIQKSSGLVSLDPKENSRPYATSKFIVESVHTKLSQLYDAIELRQLDFELELNDLRQTCEQYGASISEDFFSNLTRTLEKARDADAPNINPISVTELASRARFVVYVELLEHEIMLKGLTLGNSMSRSLATVAQFQPNLDVIIRYDSHLTREIDRTLSQLERLQRTRLGVQQPTVRVTLDP
jgi:hypothetical protein